MPGLRLSGALRALALAVLALAMAAVAPALASAAPASGEPFANVLPGNAGLHCETEAKEVEEEEDGVTNEYTYGTGVRFCKGNGGSERVPSWDGVPLDVDVTLPPESDVGPYPTIVMLHGYGSTKTEFESARPTGKGEAGSQELNETYDYNNDYYAEHGYAVVNYTARGFGKSCGSASSASSECKEHGFVHIADQRYEARDTQYLLGLLVEEGIAKRGALGVTGLSYGGGQSIELAYLKNRIRCAGPADEGVASIGNPCAGKAENEFVAWETPESGESLEINAAYARWPWSDLAYALDPNGRFLEYDPATYDQDGATGTESPLGVPLTSYQQGLYADGELDEGYYEPVTAGLEWNLTKSLLLFEHPEAENPEDQEVIDGLSAYHGGYAIPTAEEPSPLLMENGWNDDLFPPEEALRVYNSVREKYGDSADVALQFGDIGHSRGTDGPVADQYFNLQGAAFFAEKLGATPGTLKTTTTDEDVTAPAAGSTTVFRTTCPAGLAGEEASGENGGKTPYLSPSWAGLQKGDLAISSTGEQTATDPASEYNKALGDEFDPILQEEKANLSKEGGACHEFPAVEPEGTASYLLPLAEEVTLMGLPTISAEISVTGTKDEDGELDGRLWDVNAVTGKERLISRGDYRLEEPQTKNIVFQLHGNGYTLNPPDEVLKLELTTSEYPYYYSSEEPYSVTIKSLHAYLPTYTEPKTGTQVEAPVTLPMPEEPLPKAAQEPVKFGPAPTEKMEVPLTKIEPPVLTTETPVFAAPETVRVCMSKRTVTIKLPKYKKSKITKAVLTLGKKVKTVKGKSLKSVSYKFKSSVSGKTTLKLKLTVKQTKSKKTKTSTKKLSRKYDLCAKK